jgi:hypothetical protein
MYDDKPKPLADTFFVCTNVAVDGDAGAVAGRNHF